MKGKYLITTEAWFIAPDGKSYRAVWGEAQTMTALEALEAPGVEPNRNGANWMVKIGTDEHHIIIAGCQIHYAVSCPDRPNQGETKQRAGDSYEVKTKDNEIYIPEPPVKKDVETIDGKEIEWLTDGEVLRGILQRNIDLLRSPYIDGEEIARRLNAGAFVKFRSYRKSYARNITIEIVWTDGNVLII